MFVAAPPDPQQIFRDLDGERLARAMQAAASHPRNDYVHWDKLRHLATPDDLTHAEWWFAIKLKREAVPFELRDPAGHSFTYGTPPQVQRLLHYVDRHCSGEIAMPEVVTSDEHARHHYLVNSVMEEAIRSSQLEGATTSRRVAKDLLRSGRPPRDRSELMIVNNYRALELMRERMGDELSPELVMTLQRILTEGTLDDPTAAGRLQSPDEERVVVLDTSTGETIHVPPPASELPARLEAMCAFANRADNDAGAFLHPVIRGILLHFWLAYDHPFLDGNGRTARALFYWYMKSRGYWLVELLSISRILRQAPGKYNRAFLLTETDEGDTTYFLLHQLEVIQRAVKELQSYLARKVREIRDVERSIRDAGDLNHRQLALLSDAIRHPARSYTYDSHAASHGVTGETARTDLGDLAARGLLVRRKAGRRHVFSAVADLPQVLHPPV
ncbi:MAG TPA: Fic family protein [Solirubrobacteraceae bacterium]|jgi:Fic family protein|nr:Fic family protein [Solirubrobacteraceae bacterium]